MENELKIICPYCSASFTPDMMIELERAGYGCNTCGTDGDVDITIDIYCKNIDCKKLIYRKETNEYL